MIRRELNQHSKVFLLYDVACLLKHHLEVHMYACMCMYLKVIDTVAYMYDILTNGFCCIRKRTELIYWHFLV